MVMKVFVPGNKKFEGALNYIYAISKHSFPKIEISGVKELDDPITLVSNPLSSNVAYQQQGNELINIDIDIGSYKVFPSHYQLSTIIGGTPPLNFSLLGTNDPNEGWIPIDSYRYDPYLCPYTMGSSTTVCETRGIKLITPNHYVGPFRFFRYALHYNRWELGHNEREYALRLGGIELYGFFSFS
jgi:hypothetical protein